MTTNPYISRGRLNTFPNEESVMLEEVWAPIRNFPDYAVSNLGRVRSWRCDPAGPCLHLIAHGSGVAVRLRANDRTMKFPVHQLVARAFCPGETPARRIARHRDGNRKNNRADNLYWDTRKRSEKTPTEENWRPVTLRNSAVDAPGWEVSDLGAVRKAGVLVEPVMRCLNRARGDKGFQPAIDFGGGHVVLLTTVVAEAWVPNPHGSRSVRRIEKDITNNRADNLFWKTTNETSKGRKVEKTPQGEEVWQPIQGAVGYEVSNLGSIRKDGSQRVYAPRKRGGEPTAFLYCSGRVRGIQVKQLVAQAFVPNPMGHGKVSRRHGSPTLSCAAVDLEWVADGSRGSYRMGRRSTSKRAKLTPETVLDARRRVAAGERQSDVADSLGVTPTAISLAIRGKTWGWV